MPNEAAIRSAFREQAGWCRQLGSPFTALLMDGAATGLDRSSSVGTILLDWEGEAGSQFGALPLRFAGGLHALVRRGRLPGLAALYPPHGQPEGAALWRAVAKAMAEAGPELAAWLQHPPQTNEVARSAALMAGLMVVTAEHGLPISLHELGASAGLNLVLDRYAYRLGPPHDQVGAGVPGAPVLLDPEWRGPPPPAAPVHIVARRGVDTSPLDVTDPADRERLVAYVWADQAARLDRLQAALALALTDPPGLDRADAADWMETTIPTTPQPGVARVMMHSIAHQYFPPDTQARLRAHAEQVGAAATPDSPFAWLRLEVDPVQGGAPVLTLTTWHGAAGPRTRILARGSAHGTWVEWPG